MNKGDFGLPCFLSVVGAFCYTAIPRGFMGQRVLDMRSKAEQVEAIRQETGQVCGTQAETWLFGKQVRKQRGFTLVEMITVIVIIGIVGVAAIPRFFNRNVFDSRGFYDQVISTLRYAQKTAVAQHRLVCVAFTANTVTLTIDSTIPRDGICDVALNSSTGAPYLVRAQPGVAFDTVLPAVAPVNFSFDALGSPFPDAKQVITVTGYATTITLEAGTGYVH
jgi:MSHA pilin protein MshC